MVLKILDSVILSEVFLNYVLLLFLFTVIFPDLSHAGMFREENRSPL